MPWPLVGRSAQIDSGLAGLAQSGLVAFTGAPGVGKSRLMAEVVDRVEAPSRPTFRTLATAATRTLPLSPFVSLLPATPPPDPSLLLAAVLDAIDMASGDSGLVLAVDDAHHLDDASLALLAVSLPNPSIRVVLTASNDHDWPAALTALLRDDRSSRIEVDPLDEHDAARLLEQALGPVDDHLRAEVWRLARGNPLVLREVLAGAGDRLTTDARGRWSTQDSLLSSRLVDLTRGHLAGLTPEISSALVVIAAGAPVPYELLARTIAPSTLDELVAANLAEVTSAGAASVVRPAHPLYGEVLLAGTGEQRLRQALSSLVTSATAAPGLVDPLQLAVWQQRSGSEPDPAVAVAGARAALARHDGALAASLVEPVADHIGPCRSALMRGASLAQQGRPSEADEAFAAVTLSEARTDAAEVVELASARAFNLAFGLQRPNDADRLLSDVLEEVQEPVLRGRLEAERGVIAGLSGDLALAHAAAMRTVENPAAEGPALTSAYVSLTLAESMLGLCEDTEDHARAGLDLAEAWEPVLPLARSQIAVVWANSSALAGRVDRAVGLIDRELARHRSLDRAVLHATRAFVTSHVGRLDQAAASATLALDAFDPLDVHPMAIGVLGLVEAMTGRPSHLDAVEQVRSDRADLRSTIWLDRARAWGRGAAGEHAAGVDLARQNAAGAIGGDHVGWGVLALHDAVRLGGRPAAELVADSLTTTVASTQGASLLDALARHTHALAAGAPEDLLDVAVELARLGSPLLAAEASAESAGLAAEQGEPTAAARAGTLSAMWHRGCPDARTPPLTRRRPEGLTARELEIAIDAAHGDTSADIASRRYISVRTVDNHLGSAYRTLGISGRNELAQLLAPALDANHR